MHRLLLIRSKPDDPEKFVVAGDSLRPEISDANSARLEDTGGTPWRQLHRTPGYDAPSSTLPYGGSLSGLSYWHINKTGIALDYDFAAAGISERKVVTSGELHVNYDGREYVAYAGDSMLYLTDPDDRESSGALRPFLVRFLADHACSVVYTDFGVVDSPVPSRGFG